LEDVVKSVGRVFAVLETFDAARVPMSATDIARRLELPQSSAVAVLKSMTTLGYLTFDKLDRRYLPTMRTALLGQWLMDEIAPDGRLMQLVREIGEASEETVTLAAQSDLSLHFLLVVPGRKPLTLNVKAGDRFPVLLTVAGLTALSGRPDQEVLRYIERHNRRTRLPEDRVIASEIMATVVEFRRQGYGWGRGHAARGTAALSWLLPALPGGRQTVLSVAGAEASIVEARADIVETVTALLPAYLSH
jgi:IclR family KDG regulon transcriptional repressor